MKVFNVRNVHQALPIVIQALQKEGVERESRNGPVLLFDQPVTTVYNKPLERVIFYSERDANPFFHLMESLWMLAGRNDVDFPAYFVKNMRNFSDDGKTFHAAYGHRWRKHFNIDQLEVICEMLKKDPTDRRAVLSMWDANVDGLGRQGKDFACNLQCVFHITEDKKLNMTVTNRSNDIIWGAYGANAVHFSYLLEFMAAGIGVEVGKYYQVSNNLHAYKNTLEKVKNIKEGTLNPYDEQGIKHIKLVNTPMEEWHQDLLMFMQEGDNAIGYKDEFFRKVAVPVLKAFKLYKANQFDNAKVVIQTCKDTAWLAACYQWLDRRQKAALKAADDGVNYED
jgi:thymidylate synthase